MKAPLATLDPCAGSISGCRCAATDASHLSTTHQRLNLTSLVGSTPVAWQLLQDQRDENTEAPPPPSSQPRGSQRPAQAASRDVDNGMCGMSLCHSHPVEAMWGLVVDGFMIVFVPPHITIRICIR